MLACRWSRSARVFQQPARATRMTNTAFAQQHEQALRLWGTMLLDGESPIVAISRKAPRLLELALREGLLPPALLSRITTERALAVRDLCGDAKSIVLCDDLVIVGSTFGRLADVIGALEGGKHVEGVPFGIV